MVHPHHGLHDTQRVVRQHCLLYGPLVAHYAHTYSRAGIGRGSQLGVEMLAVLMVTRRRQALTFHLIWSRCHEPILA